MTKFRIEFSNNSDARTVREIPGCELVKHNGGKTVIALSSDRHATAAWLDVTYKVRSYTTEEVL